MWHNYILLLSPSYELVYSRPTEL
uniref:Uncharacterized protein n=1 Tax=Anguilla anguilla TaxID=7936 RepID=A0A0E9SE06_ANGAN